jgi:hypothetical protein
VLSPSAFTHPVVTRRAAVRAGAVGLLGLGLEHLAPLRAAGPNPDAKSVVFVFLSGGLGQHDSFDPKPDAPAEIRGEFAPIATKTPGIKICEHLPRLAARGDKWALVRSLTHGSNDHSTSHHIVLTGRSVLPPGFDRKKVQPSDWPSIAAVAGAVTRSRNNLPPAVVLPERLIHMDGVGIPGQYGGVMGRARDPWFLEMSPFVSDAYGAYPEYEFDHQQRRIASKRTAFTVPELTLPEGLTGPRVAGRLDLLKSLDEQRRELERAAVGVSKSRQDAVSLLTDPAVRTAFDLGRAAPRDLDRYGRNAFGWSLLLATRLIEAGVNLVQVNLGNNETWDTHGNAFPHLKDKLFPPTDRAVSAFLDDLADRGLLDSTLIVMCGEFGRTPKISYVLPEYKLPGRDHWGACLSVFLAGGGVKGGTVIGSSDAKGAYPSTDPQTPENLAVTIYHALGIPKATTWPDAEGRPHNVYYGEPIRGLM